MQGSTALVPLELLPELRTVAAWPPPQRGSALEWDSLERSRHHRTLKQNAWEPYPGRGKVLFAKPPAGLPRCSDRTQETFGSYPGKNACVSANKSCECRKTGFAWCLWKHHQVLYWCWKHLMRGARGPSIDRTDVLSLL